MSYFHNYSNHSLDILPFSIKDYSIHDTKALRGLVFVT